MTTQPELFDRTELKIDAAGGVKMMRHLHGSRACNAKCLSAQPSSPCDCPCNGVCHSSGRCILRRALP